MRVFLMGIGLFFFGISTLFAQVPQNYYAGTEDLEGFMLKTTLHQILLNTHNPQAYSTHWAFFETADVLPTGNVWDIYANCGFQFGTPANGGNQDVGTGGNVECEFFNREHTFPTSWFGGNIEPMRSDVVHIFPADKKVNNERANLPFANVGTVFFTSTNQSKRGNSATPGVTGQVFEIADEFKGDVARALFYMATRYENQIASWEQNNPDGNKMLNGTSQQVFEDWALQLLYEWHINDPVSEKEINRNNAIMNYQGNRNPFVDFPQWVCEIWNVNNCTLSQSSFSSERISLIPNPSSNGVFTLTGMGQSTSIEVYSLQGQTLQRISANGSNEKQIKLEKKGIYLIRVTADKGSQVLKAVFQ